MTKKTNPFEQLERIFHEPKRLAIMTALCTAEAGLSFSELKAQCDLTDGNLSRHLSTLKESKAIRIQKEFVKNSPRTTVFITETGLSRFNEYLEALSSIMETFQQTLPENSKIKLPFFAKPNPV